MLRDLAAKAAEAKSENEAYLTAAEVLGTNELDIPFSLFYVLDKRGSTARLVAASGWPDYKGPAAPAEISMAESGSHSWPLADVLKMGREMLVGDLSARFGELPAGRWNARPESAVILPLLRTGKKSPYAILICGVSPHRALGERYRQFFQSMADQVANVIANAGAYEAEKKRAEALAEIDRAKTAFFSNVSHEFRTPLTLILGPIEDALATAEKSLQGENLIAVHRSALRLSRLVNSLLDFARIEAGRL
jgi:signal transduction histidine kinase